MQDASNPAIAGANATLTIRRRTSRLGYTIRQYPARVVSATRTSLVVEYVNDLGRVARRAAFTSQVQLHEQVTA